MVDAAWVIVGRIRKAHGIRGELVVEPITDAPDAVFASGRRVFAGDTAGELVPDAPPLDVVRSRAFKDGLLVTFASITDRNEAERWRDRYVLARPEDLPPIADDEIFVHDLLGLRVRRSSGEDIGAVIDIYELPQGLVLEIDRGAAGNVLVPFHESMVDRVDVDARLIVLDPPPGLLDE